MASGPFAPAPRRRREWWPGVLGLVIAASLVVAVVGGVEFVRDLNHPLLGDPPSKAERASIERADCAQLAVLYEQYQSNADSVEPDFTAFRLVGQRMKGLGCPPPTTAPLPTSNFPGQGLGVP